jgi:hypothetical protein
VADPRQMSSKAAATTNAGSAAEPAQAEARSTRVPRGAMQYEPNPKHKEPWQRGARGSLCPAGADGPALLAESEPDPGRPARRYATDGTRAYCGHEHMPGRWHGFPLEWRAVPAPIRNSWLAQGRVSKRGIRDYW